MRELNPIGREENTLLLVSADGERFTVAVDDTLMRTLKEHRVPDSSGEQLSPRQIQDAVRAGESVSQIAERSGTSLSLVERFAHPVIEELQHMVDLALSIRVELPADRFNEIEKKPFGDVVSENLANNGASDVRWGAKRSENSIWEIILSYQMGDEKGSAIWTFDPKRYQLTPETTSAQALSKPGSSTDSPIRATPRSITLDHPSNGDAVVTADKLEAFRSRRAKAEIAAVSEVDVVTDLVEDVITPEPEPEAEPEAVAEVIQITQVIEIVPEDIGEESQEPIHAEFESKPAVETKKSRAPMPSWDQIVRGTQSDDGEAF
ncbi:MAG: hypothetical protein RLY83_442 [Actinomycetota bacterium]